MDLPKALFGQTHMLASVILLHIAHAQSVFPTRVINNDVDNAVSPNLPSFGADLSSSPR